MTSNTADMLGKRLLVARRDAPDFRDFVYRPALIALRPELPVPSGLHIRDQGRSAACTGFGLAAVIDRLLALSGGHSAETAVSARMLYEMALRHDEWAGEDDAGSSCRGVIKGWYNMGVCREALYPFDRKPGRSWSIEAAKDARSCTVGAYYRLGSRISDYHAALNEVGSILCSATLHDGWKKPDRETGRIARGQASRGGHAFAIVGYDRDGFWIQNSWADGWGRNGTALWSYEDWQLNVRDAWVFQLALPTPGIWHLPARTTAESAKSGKRASPARTEIAGHFVHLDDGQFRHTGRYWSHIDDVRLTATHLANSDKYDHLLLYCHGGLNSPAASARRIAAMKETFKSNRIYPYHLMYDTGILEELKDVIVGRRRQADDRAGGLADWIDQLVEKLTRVPGRALWREMKAGARLPFTEGNAGTQTLRAFTDAFNVSGKPKHIHLAGHSTGMILLTHLLRRWALIAPGYAIRTASLLAPAGSVDLFTEQIQPFLKARYPDFRVSEMTVYNLTDDMERRDTVSLAYNKSLLYLVSRAFEERTPAKILGMQRYSEVVGRRKLPRLTIHYSKGRRPGARVSAATTHDGFDNDPLTMNHILRRVLRVSGLEPVSEFTSAGLEY
jgi:hypothetical protein